MDKRCAQLEEKIQLCAKVRMLTCTQPISHAHRAKAQTVQGKGTNIDKGNIVTARKRASMARHACIHGQPFCRAQVAQVCKQACGLCACCAVQVRPLVPAAGFGDPLFPQPARAGAAAAGHEAQERLLVHECGCGWTHVACLCCACMHDRTAHACTTTRRMHGAGMRSRWHQPRL